MVRAILFIFKILNTQETGMAKTTRTCSLYLVMAPVNR